MFFESGFAKELSPAQAMEEHDWIYDGGTDPRRSSKQGSSQGNKRYEQ